MCKCVYVCVCSLLVWLGGGGGGGGGGFVSVESMWLCQLPRLRLG